NQTQLAKGINLMELPQTFQDAVFVTRRLGYRFLYIDSICIMQDSATDWEREASNMNQVYQNYIFNIAASESDTPSHGLFRQKDRSIGTPFRVKFRTSLVEDDYYCFYDLWDGFAKEAPLNARGWVFQERMLSPRTIYFATLISGNVEK
ncbi:uncharacterized protein BDZ99DRAFT_379437, partial [Mytilinidion resinicola]